MKLLKVIIITTCIFFFIGHISLSSEDKWPSSFDEIKFYQITNKGPIDVDFADCFDNDAIKFQFNNGYNGTVRDRSPIERKHKQLIYATVKELLPEVLPEVCNELKKCSILNDIFGKKVQENLNSFPKALYFCYDLAGDGTVNNFEVILDADYLLNFVYNAGKQLHENNGKGLNLTPADFYIKDGKPVNDSIQKTISHEMTHYLTGLKGGGLLSECVVHCLTKKCHDQNHNLKDYTYKRFETDPPRPLECDILPKNQLNNISDKIIPQMGQPACFCDTDWKTIKKLVESEDCENPNPPGGENRTDTPDDNYSYSSGSSSASGVSNAASLSNLLSSLNVFPLASGQSFISYSYYPDILVYDKFNYPDLPGLQNITAILTISMIMSMITFPVTTGYSSSPPAN